MGHCLETIFSGCAETGSISKSKLRPATMKAALRNVNFMHDLPDGSDEGYHEVRVSPNNRRSGRRIFIVPTLSTLLKSDAYMALSRYPEVNMMRMGFHFVAEAIQQQRKEPENVVKVRSILSSAGHAIATSLQMVSECAHEGSHFFSHGRRPAHQSPNYVRRSAGEAIARKLFEAGLKYNN